MKKIKLNQNEMYEGEAEKSREEMFVAVNNLAPDTQVQKETTSGFAFVRKIGTHIAFTPEQKSYNEQRLHYMLSQEFVDKFMVDNPQIYYQEKNGKRLYYNPSFTAFLKHRMAEKGLSGADVIKILGNMTGTTLTPITFSRKLRGLSSFSTMEMRCLVEILELDIYQTVFAFNLVPWDAISY